MANTDSNLRRRASGCCRGSASRHLPMLLLLLLFAAAINATDVDTTGTPQETTPSTQTIATLESSSGVAGADSQENSSNVLTIVSEFNSSAATGAPQAATTPRASVESVDGANAGSTHESIAVSESISSAAAGTAQVATTGQASQEFTTDTALLLSYVNDSVDGATATTDGTSDAGAPAPTAKGVAMSPSTRKDVPHEAKEGIVIASVLVAKDIDIINVRDNFTCYLMSRLKTIDKADLQNRGRRQAAPSGEVQADIDVQYTEIRDVSYSEANWEFEYYATHEGKIIPANVLVQASKEAAEEHQRNTDRVVQYYSIRQKWTLDERSSADAEFRDNSRYVKAILGIIGALVGLVSIAVIAVWLVNRRRTKSFSFTKSNVDAESGYKLSGVENPVMANEILAESRAEPLSSKPAPSTNGHTSLGKTDDEAMIIPLDQLQAEVKI